ncbi:beta strand repeat-containing protein [Calidithermus chliarophilus]|uniref:beta strand repeat-containing protein n=1 Tax=Calidithermus chliarophilus TaxID=52023 RepID=UPI0004146090|nr:hypothetical protein [Calidithermus chliarophilus]
MKLRLSPLPLVLLALSACTQGPATPKQPPATPPAFKPRLVGSLEASFDAGARTARATFTPLKKRRLLGTAALVNEADLKLTPLSFTAIDAGGGQRFLNATFKVQNLGATGLNNLTLVAYYRKKPGAENVNGSAFFDIRDFGGGSSNAGEWALRLQPAHGMKTQGAGVTVDDSHADLQIFTPAQAATLQSDAQSAGLINAGGVTGETVLQYGYVVRNAGGGRAVAGNSDANSVTVALKVPTDGDAGPNSAYRYSMTFLVFEDNITRVTESLEEQPASGVAARASAVGAAQVAVMCGTGYSGANPLYVPGVTLSVGSAAAYDRWMGGDFTITGSTPPTLAVTGNVPKTFADSAVLGNYQPLGGATLAANNFASTDPNTLTDGSGAFTFTRAAGQRTASSFTFGVSDGSCTLPGQSANVTVSGMYWFVKNDAGAGNGSFASPFNTLAAAQAASQAGDVIFVYRGNGTSAGQNAGITLKNGQKLIGEGAGLTVDAVNIPAGASPLIGNAAGAGVSLAQDNEVRGLDVGGTSGGLTGSNFGTLTASSLSVTASAGPALNLSNGNLAATFRSLSSSGGANNLALSNTTGSLTVTGDGSTAGSGGTLQNASAEAVKLSNPGSVTLRFVNVKNSGTHAVSFTASSGTQGLTLQNAVVESAGQGGGISGHGVLADVTGSGTVASLSLSGSTLRQHEQSGMFVWGRPGSNATVHLTATGNTFQNNAANGLDLVLESSGASTYTVSNNTLTNAPSLYGGITVRTEVAGSSPLIQGRISGNTFDLNPGTASSSAGSVGILVEMNGSETSRLELSGNNPIRDYDTYGVGVSTGSTTGGRLDLTLSNNDVSNPSDPGNLALRGFNLHAGSTTTAGGSNRSTLCLNMTGNTTPANTGAYQGARLRQFSGHNFLIQGFSGPGTDAGTVQSYVQGQNPASAVNVHAAGTGTVVNYAGGTCTPPSF